MLSLFFSLYETFENMELIRSTEKTFSKYFKNKKDYWFGWECTDEQQWHRITALLFLADMLESSLYK